MNLIAWLIGRGDPARGREMLDDARELFEERRLRRGWLYAWSRLGWDIAALFLRSAGGRPAVQPRRGTLPTRLSAEARDAWRAVRRRPVVTMTVIASLGLGLGLTMLTFTLVDAILVRPLRFPRSHELLLVYSEFRPESGYEFARFALSAPEIADYASQNDTVDVAAYAPGAVTFGDGRDTPERVPAVRAASGVFRILETAPVLGRTLHPTDERAGAPCVAVVSFGLWHDRLAGDRGVVGKHVRVDGAPCEIVGIMPASFAFPTETARLWLRLPPETDPDTRGNHGLMAVGRRRSGVSLDRARQNLTVLMARWAQSLPHHKGHSVVIAPLRDELVFRVERQLLVLAAAVSLVLLTIAANMSSLLVAHGESRRRELAVRGALGASRTSLTRQLLMEGWLLAGLGGIAGGVLAWLSLGAIIQTYPGTLPRASELRFEMRTALIGTGVSFLIGTLVALLPALRLTRTRPDALHNAARGGQAAGLRPQQALVVAELAIGVAVTVAALLLVQSFMRLQRVPLGFAPDGVTAGVIGVPADPQGGSVRARQYFVELEARLQAQPGVAAAGAISSLPLAASPPPDDFTIEGRPVARPSEPGFNAGYVMVTPGAFEALRVPLARGRPIDGRDRADAPAVAVINETLARTYWSTEDPIGRRIRYAESVRDGEWAEWGPWITIVGIVKDIRGISPTEPPRPTIYVAHAQRPRTAYDGRTMGVVVRGDPAAASLLPRVVRQIDPDASVSAVRTMETLAGAAVAQPRFMGWIMTIFAAIALLVAALGVYGVVAYGVERRTPEIGLRLALGASRSSVVRLMSRQTLAMTLAGLLIGLAAAAGLAQWMRTMLFEVEPFAPALYAGVCLILAGAVAIATVLPLRRATRVDPLIALRSE